MALALIVFAAWTTCRSGNSFDQVVFDRIDPMITAGRTRLMKFVSFFGNTWFLIPANLSLFFWFVYKKNIWWAIRVAFVSLTSVGMMTAIKQLFHRHRPPYPLVEGITNFSFPSGHAFMSVAFYGLIIYWILDQVIKKWLQRCIVVFCVLLVLFIGFSRVYLRVHYLTDVMAGFGLGTAWLIISWHLLNTFQGGYLKKPE